MTAILHHLTTPVEELETARVENDWNVSKVKGRWEVRVHPDDGPSNLVEVKINKRAQIVNLARGYARYEQINPKGSEGYNACSGFVDTHVYGRLGLSPIGLDALSGVQDGGSGALRFFQNWAGPKQFTPAFTGNANHVAIQDGAEQIDTNWNNFGEGPTVRPLDYGIGTPSSLTARYWSNAISRAPKGEYNTALSILQELDAE